MNCNELVNRVQHDLKLPGLGETLRALRATLTTLGERLHAGEAKDLASNLPMEIDRYLLEADSGQRFDYSEFVSRVSERGKIDKPDAAYQAQQLMAIVAEAVPAGEIRDIRDGLPEEFDDLFEQIPLKPMAG